MKLFFYLVVLLVLPQTVFAIELVCKGSKPVDSKQRAMYVDCNSRQDVSDYLLVSYQQLGKRPDTKQFENFCYSGYKTIIQAHPSQVSSLAPSALDRCNTGMNELK